MPGKHSKLSPSSADKWLNCAMSAELSAQVPETESEAAREGTMKHGLIEDFIRSYGWEGITGNYGYFLERSNFQKNDESYNLYKALNTFIAEVVDAPEGFYFDLERQLLMPNIWPGCWGTADVVLTSHNSAYIMDYKFGRGPVDPGSVQLQVYLAGLYNDLKKEGKLKDILYFYAVIIQPKLTDRPKVKEYSKKDVQRFILRYRNRLKKFNENPVYKTGEWCEKFAKCAALCPAYKKAKKEAFINFFDSENLFKK